jgi:UDP-N-acetylmuramoyl-tripeptide--D-alanyl-D-alanine ligase
MPADTRFGVFEIGMNHAGEITPLSQMVRPHVAIVTTVEAVHIEHFADGVPGIARAKAEIFAGLEAPGAGEFGNGEAGGLAVIPLDNAQAGILAAAAVAAGAAVVPFSLATPGPAEAMPTAGVHLVDASEEPDATRIVARLSDGSTRELMLGLPGRHNLSNALAVVAALAAVLPSADVRHATAALAAMTPPPGRVRT